MKYLFLIIINVAVSASSDINFNASQSGNNSEFFEIETDLQKYTESYSEDQVLVSYALCSNHQPDETWPYCCANRAQNFFCCTNGANNPTCTLPTVPDCPTVAPTLCMNGQPEQGWPYCCANRAQNYFCCSNGANNPTCLLPPFDITTPNPEGTRYPLCSNGQEDYTWPYCCANRVQNYFCCSNGANNPTCLLPTPGLSTPSPQPIPGCRSGEVYPMCGNGQPDSTWPYCCPNRAQNYFCCANGANNPTCTLPTPPIVAMEPLN